jgi:hypothetical protein
MSKYIIRLLLFYVNCIGGHMVTAELQFGCRSSYHNNTPKIKHTLPFTHQNLLSLTWLIQFNKYLILKYRSSFISNRSIIQILSNVQHSCRKINEYNKYHLYVYNNDIVNNYFRGIAFVQTHTTSWSRDDFRRKRSSNIDGHNQNTEKGLTTNVYRGKFNFTKRLRRRGIRRPR